MEALEQLVDEKGMKDLVIDLRHNPGGYLQQATQILSQLFRKKGQLLVYTQGYASHRTEYKTHGRALFDIGKIAVLIDENSASASEIMAGALQDHDRALIVGRRSFGKGLVQEPYLLSDGSALRLTVARFYTPSGRSIQKSYEDMERYREDVWQRIENGELTSAEKQIVLDSTPYYTDKGRTVYGGGGIQPDVFVPLDPVYYESVYMDVRPHVQEFVYRQRESGFLEGKTVSLSMLNSDFALLNPLYSDLQKFIADKNMYISENDWQLIEKRIKEQILAEVADLFLGKEAYFRVLGEADPVLKEARSALRRNRSISKNNG
jgi:carboxyl-terminal processing protease